MLENIRVVVVGTSFGAMAMWGVMFPVQLEAFADEPAAAISSALGRLFPVEKIDPNIFARYDITFDDSVSTDVQRTQTVTKIGYGYASEVSVVTTPSGTYSSDAITSPHVLYPGIDVEILSPLPIDLPPAPAQGYWSSYSAGSFIFFVFAAGQPTGV
jgi:hypothetical protein